MSQGQRPLRTAGTASRLGRGLAGALLFMQALLWVVAPVVDGWLDASSAGAVVHIEAQGATKCPRVHSSVDCLICRTLNERVALTSATPTLLAGAAPVIPAPEWLAYAPMGFHRSALQSRAPPAGTGASRPIA